MLYQFIIDYDFNLNVYTFRPHSKIIDLSVSNNVLVIGLESGHIKRIDINNTTEPDSKM